jgi:hypothetical protein
MKLEPKHIFAYLPYKVQVSKIHILNIGKCEGNGIGSINHILSTKSGQYKMWLHPLSDLTKEIEVNGEKFIPIKILENIVYGINIYKPTNYPLELTVMTCDYSQEIDYYNGYLIVQKLCEWHFDVFGLIDAGLVVDINTVDL